MPISELAAEEKSKAWKVIEQHLGTMIQPTGRRDWRITEDGKVSVFIIFSKYHNESDNYWYGLNPSDLDQWLRYEHSFVIFVLGKHQELLIIPIDQLHPHIRKANLKLDKWHHVKLHITSERGKYLFKEFPHFDTSGGFAQQ